MLDGSRFPFPKHLHPPRDPRALRRALVQEAAAARILAAQREVRRAASRPGRLVRLEAAGELRWPEGAGADRKRGVSAAREGVARGPRPAAAGDSRVARTKRGWPVRWSGRGTAQRRRTRPPVNLPRKRCTERRGSIRPSGCRPSRRTRPVCDGCGRRGRSATSSRCRGYSIPSGRRPRRRSSPLAKSVARAALRDHPRHAGIARRTRPHGGDRRKEIVAIWRRGAGKRS